MELPEAHRRALDATARIVAGIRPDQWEAATPCSAWDVRAVLNHLVGENLWVVELGRGATIEDVGDRLDGDVLGTDPVAAYERSAAGAAAVFDAPEAMEQPFAVSYGPVPGVVYAGHRFVDALIHGWDLAVATEQ